MFLTPTYILNQKKNFFAILYKNYLKNFLLGLIILNLFKILSIFALRNSFINIRGNFMPGTMIYPVIWTPEMILKNFNSGVNINCPNARSLMDISLSNPSSLKTNKEYSVKKNADVTALREKLKLPKSKIDRILVYSEDSDLSKSLSNSANIKKAVLDWKAGRIVNKNGNRKSKFVVSANDTQDLKRAINGCTITGLKENSDGSVSGYVYDIYNFDSSYTDMKTVGKDLSFVNKVACYLQRKGIIHNYQLLVPIRIKFDKKG